MSIDYNEEYSVLILHDLNVRKANAIPKINQMFPGQQIFMIGNSMSDFVGDQVVHCAVGNATDDYKRQCLLVAPVNMEYTMAVEYLFEKIACQ